MPTGSGARPRTRAGIGQAAHPVYATRGRVDGAALRHELKCDALLTMPKEPHVGHEQLYPLAAEEQIRSAECSIEDNLQGVEGVGRSGLGAPLSFEVASPRTASLKSDRRARLNSATRQSLRSLSAPSLPFACLTHIGRYQFAERVSAGARRLKLLGALAFALAAGYPGYRERWCAGGRHRNW